MAKWVMQAEFTPPEFTPTCETCRHIDKLYFKKVSFFLASLRKVSRACRYRQSNAMPRAGQYCLWSCSRTFFAARTTWAAKLRA
eukprot:6463178-Amphidinium_carterae.1